MNDKNRDKSNLFLAIALSVVVLVGWQYFYKAPQVEQQQQQTTQTGGSAPKDPLQISAPGISAEAAAAAAAAKTMTKDEILATTARVRIETPALSGSLALKGGRLDDLILLGFRETTAPDSPAVRLFSPVAGYGSYFSEFGWVSDNKNGDIAVPGADTLWTASADKLTPDHPVTLTWDNGQGLLFTRVVSVDADFMFTVTQKVENTTSTPVTLFPYSLIARGGTPQIEDFYIQHEGPLGVIGGTLHEKKYKALREDEHRFEGRSVGGWVGFGDKYWLSAIIPDQTAEGVFRKSWHKRDGLDRYQTDWMGDGLTVEPGQTIESVGRLFAGAKVLSLLDKYASMYNIPLFDRAIDFGWLWFLTIPFFYFLRFIHEHVSNFGISIMLFTVVIKLALFPIANRSYRSMSRMKKLQPMVKELQERFKDDKELLNKEVMALYKREKVNPVSGCLPVLIQIPVFFALYKVLYVAIEMRHAPFFGWIQDLSAPDPTTLFNLFGLIDWTPPAMLMIGAWPILMGITMFLQQKLNPAPADPVQAKIFMFLPFVFTFMLARFPAGLVIYWAWSNILSIIQQWVIMRSVNKE